MLEVYKRSLGVERPGVECARHEVPGRWGRRIGQDAVCFHPIVAKNINSSGLILIPPIYRVYVNYAKTFWN
jgi:hypothetical protein